MIALQLFPSRTVSLYMGRMFLIRTFAILAALVLVLQALDLLGESGKILAVLPKKQQVLIEGVRLIKKHTKRSQDNPQGAIIEREGPLHISNVKRVEEAEATSKTTKTKSKKKEKAS